MGRRSRHRDSTRAGRGGLAPAAALALVLASATAAAGAQAPGIPLPIEPALPAAAVPVPVPAPADAAAADEPPAPGEPDDFPTPLDPDIERAQGAKPLPVASPADGAAAAPATGPGGLPLAVEKPGGDPAAAQAEPPKPDAGAGAGAGAAFVLPPERLPIGRQTIGLTVDVVAPQYVNIHQVTSFKVVIRNSGQADAMGVVVRDELPEGLEYVSSQPEARRTGNLLSWELETLPAGSERTIQLSVKPTRTGPFDHAATLALKAGARYRTLVREPKLKVEQSVSTERVLKGKPVSFKIAVSNPGDGPVRNVIVQAKLSPGLRHESGEGNDQNLFEQTLDLINPGERVALDVLVADAVQGGVQSCVVVAHSADVVADQPEARSQRDVTVVEPRLALAISGPKERFTDTLAAYEIVVTNPGTATAENVRVQATLPVSGRLYALPSGARFDAQTRRLSWAAGPIEPGGKLAYAFQLRMGGVGLYDVGAEARADGGITAKEIAQTDVTGLADIDLSVTENRRAIDVDDTTTFVIKVINRGTADATNIQISGKLAETIVPIESSGTEKQVQWDKKDTLMFPLIERLGPGKMMELGIKVRGVKPGVASCRIFLLHDGMDKDERLDDLAVCKVMTTRR